MHDSFEFMSEQSSRKNSAEQNPQDAVKPWAASQPSDDQASTVPRQYTYPGAANQTEASIAVTTAKIAVDGHVTLVMKEHIEGDDEGQQDVADADVEDGQHDLHGLLSERRAARYAVPFVAFPHHCGQPG